MIVWEKLQEAVAKGDVSRRKHDSFPLSIYTYSKMTEINKNWNEVTKICRGLILHDETKEVIANPFPKFFNIEEQAEDKRLEGNKIIKYKGINIQIPDHPYIVYEKMDGSIIYVVMYNNNLIVSSKGSFNSAQAKKAEELIKKKYSLAQFVPGLTYIFELIYPENRIVVNYGDREELVLLGIRNTESGLELQHQFADNFAQDYKFARPIMYDKSIEDLLIEKDLPFENREGYVVHFDNGEKLKIKFNAYFDLHKIITNVTSKDILDALSNGKSIAEFCETKDIPDEMLKDIIKIEDEYKEAFTVIEMNGKNLYEEASTGIDLLDPTGTKEIAMKIQMKSQDSIIKAVAFAIMRNKDYKNIIFSHLKDLEKDNRQFIGKSRE